MVTSGSFEIAVRSNIMPRTRSRSVRTLQAAHLGIELARQVALEVQDLLEVAPAQIRGESNDLVAIRPSLGKPYHREEILPAETSAILARQLSRQRRDNFVPIPGTCLAENIPPDTVTDLPVEQHEVGIDGLSDPQADGFDESANISRQVTG